MSGGRLAEVDDAGQKLIGEIWPGGRGVGTRKGSV